MRAGIDAALGDGRLRRLRRGLYVTADTPPEAGAALALGGTVDCVSLLRLLGVFVLRDHRLHVRLEPHASRVPTPTPNVVRHWRTDSESEGDGVLIGALARAVRCQEPRAAIAMLDSAWHIGLVDEEDLARVFALLPARFVAFRWLLDPLAESGYETLMRLLLRSLGCDVEVQVQIDGVGRVDLLVDGWLIVECDSEAHHGGWDAQRRDRRRDLAAAERGYVTLRPIAEDIEHHSGRVLAAVARLLEHGRRHNSGKALRRRRV